MSQAYFLSCNRFFRSTFPSLKGSLPTGNTCWQQGVFLFPCKLHDRETEALCAGLTSKTIRKKSGKRLAQLKPTLMSYNPLPQELAGRKFDLSAQAFSYLPERVPLKLTLQANKTLNSVYPTTRLGSTRCLVGLSQQNPQP